MTAKRILVIYAYTGDWDNLQLTVKLHLTTLEKSQHRHKIDYYNALEDAPQYSIQAADDPTPPKDLPVALYDVVVLHNTFLAYRWTDWYFYKWKRRYSWINDLHCQKIAVPQDEFDHSGILDEWLLELGVTDIFSRYLAENREGLYPIMRQYATFTTCLPGYIDQEFAQNSEATLRPIHQRPVDIVYRARHLPYWFGHLGQLKHQIAREVIPVAKSLNLNIDISTDINDTIVGQGWLHFLANSKTIIGCEGGSSAIDWRGELRAWINEILRSDPDIDFQTLSDRLPKGWDRYRFATLTPRHFEAITTKTCQVLVEGYYSGILKPNIHYLSINRDFSNLNAVLELITKPDLLEEIAERAYQEIYLQGHYSYSDFCHLFDQAISNYDKRLKEANMETQDPVAILERILASERHDNALLQAQYRQQLESLTQQAAHLSNSIDQLISKILDLERVLLSEQHDNTLLQAQYRQQLESLTQLRDYSSNSIDQLISKILDLERILLSEQHDNALLQDQNRQQLESLTQLHQHQLSASIERLRQHHLNASQSLIQIVESIEIVNRNVFKTKRELAQLSLILIIVLISVFLFIIFL